MRKFHKHTYKSGSKPYIPKNMRTHLGNLSVICFGTRSKWQKFCALHGIDIPSILEQMEAIVEYKKQQWEEFNNARKEVRPGKTEDVINTAVSADGGGKSYDLRGDEVRGPQLATGDGLESSDVGSDAPRGPVDKP